VETGTHRSGGVFVAADVHYLASGDARGAVGTADAAHLVRHMAGQQRLPDAYVASIASPDPRSRPAGAIASVAQWT
jgi:hypothetical protein